MFFFLEKKQGRCSTDSKIIEQTRFFIIYFLNMRFPQLAFAPCWRRDNGFFNWTMALVDSLSKLNETFRNVIRGFPFNDYSCVFPSLGWAIWCRWNINLTLIKHDLACTSCVPGAENGSSIEKDETKKIHTHSYKHSFALIHFNLFLFATLGVCFRLTTRFTGHKHSRTDIVEGISALSSTLVC